VLPRLQIALDRSNNSYDELRDKCSWHAVQDHAGGMSKQALRKSQHFFVSSVVPGEPTYTYSKDHGVIFSGLGVGLAMAALYVQYMGGSLRVEQHEEQQGKGTCVTIRLPIDGFEVK
jgi:K+-sensing histidine kinase KdpD